MPTKHVCNNYDELLRWLSGKESACFVGDIGDAGSIPGSGISSGEGNDNPLQYSFLENPMDTGQREPGSSP